MVDHILKKFHDWEKNYIECLFEMKASKNTVGIKQNKSTVITRNISLPPADAFYTVKRKKEKKKKKYLFK